MTSVDEHFISLLFDITGWIENAGDYKKIPATAKTKIKMIFSGKFDIKIVGRLCDICGEIKFGNEKSRPMLQDDLPGYAPIIKRPFSVFCVRDENNLCIDFLRSIVVSLYALKIKFNISQVRKDVNKPTISGRRKSQKRVKKQ